MEPFYLALPLPFAPLYIGLCRSASSFKSRFWLLELIISGGVHSLSLSSYWLSDIATLGRTGSLKGGDADLPKDALIRSSLFLYLFLWRLTWFSNRVESSGTVIKGYAFGMMDEISLTVLYSLSEKWSTTYVLGLALVSIKILAVSLIMFLPFWLVSSL